MTAWFWILISIFAAIPLTAMFLLLYLPKGHPYGVNGIPLPPPPPIPNRPSYQQLLGRGVRVMRVGDRPPEVFFVQVSDHWNIYDYTDGAGI